MGERIELPPGMAPRFLSREEAAAYVGVGVDLFEQEVLAGMWPRPLRRGRTGRRLTWDRLALDRHADLISISSEEPAGDPAPAPDQAAGPVPLGMLDEAALLRRIAR